MSDRTQGTAAWVQHESCGDAGDRTPEPRSLVSTNERPVRRSAMGQKITSAPGMSIALRRSQLTWMASPKPLQNKEQGLEPKDKTGRSAAMANKRQLRSSICHQPQLPVSLALVGEAQLPRRMLHPVLENRKLFERMFTTAAARNKRCARCYFGSSTRTCVDNECRRPSIAKSNSAKNAA